MIEVKDKFSAKILSRMKASGHEQVVFCNDKDTGLRAIIAIHDTTLGPALGGARMWNYINEQEALEDVLRLSRGMTFKAAISGLDLGGGKAVIIGDADIDKTKEMMMKFGDFVDSLGGKYITAEDVGMTLEDMRNVGLRTKHVTGTPESLGGSGDPSPVTAYGVYMGMKAAAKFKWGSDNLRGRRILIQGVGKVGEDLVKHVSKELAEVYVTDINEKRLNYVASKYQSKIIDQDTIFEVDCDIYAPCALGGTLNNDSINMLKCEVIAGAANNQLHDEDLHSIQIKKKGIIYAPDFLINAGGLINVYSEIKGYDKNESLQKTSKIYDTTLEILLTSENKNITTHQAALIIAERRISESKK